MDAVQGRLSRVADWSTVPLTPKAIETLTFLVEHPQELLDKETLLAAIWPTTTVEENSLTQTISGLRRALGESRGENRYIATVPGRGYRFVSDVTRRVAGPKRVLAVLPFGALTPADRNESLEFGMTETLITSLNTLTDMSVCPLSSVRSYAAPDRDALAAGEQLGVDFVLEGSLQYQDARLRVLVRLVRVADGRQIWAATFEEDFTTIFDLQSAIAGKVTKALSIELVEKKPRGVVKHDTRDAEAYRLYASGRLAWSTLTPTGVEQAIEYFGRAIRRDPRYARAYAGLSDCYAVLAVFQIRSPHSVFPQACAAASKAVEIDPNLAEACVAVGHAKAQYRNDWRGAERAYARAIKLDPACTFAYLYQGLLSGYRGEFDRALVELRWAQHLEPMWVEPRTCVGMLLYFARRYPEAIAELEQTLAVEERSDHARSFLGRAYLHTNQTERALAEFRACRNPTPGSSADIGSALALLGRRDEAVGEVTRLTRLREEHYVSSYDIATIQASLGDAVQALHWIDRAVTERATMVGFLPHDPAFDALHDDPRFTAMVAGLGTSDTADEWHSVS